MDEISKREKLIKHSVNMLPPLIYFDKTLLVIVSIALFASVIDAPV